MKNVLNKLIVVGAVVLLLAIGVRASIRFGTHSTGQRWYGQTGDLILTSSGRAYAASGNGLQSAIYSFNSSGGTVYLPDARVVLGQKIVLKENITIRGEGIGSTILDATGVTGSTFNTNSPAAAQRNITLEGFTLDGSTTGTAGINLAECWNPVLRDVFIRDYTIGCGLLLDGGTYGSSGLDAHNVHVYRCGYGVNITNSAAGFCTVNSFYGCSFVANTFDGVNISQSGGSVANTEFFGCQFEGNGKYGIYVGASTGTRLFSCWLETNSVNEIKVGTSGWDFMMIGGVVSFDTSAVEVKTVSSAGHGAVFYNVRNMYNTTVSNDADYIIFRDRTQYYLVNGSYGGVERVGNFVTILNEAMSKLGTNGGTVLLRRGTYVATSILYVQANTVLRGESMDSTFISGKRMQLNNDNSGLEDLTLISSDAEGLTVDGSHNTHVWNVNITGYATVPVVFSNGASNYSFINVIGVCGLTVPLYNMSVGLLGANIPVGTMWYNPNSNKLYVHVSAGVWKSSAFT